jgi:hypothetical protein
MPNVTAGVLLKRLCCTLSVGLALVVLTPGLARAAKSWQSGPLVESQDNDCITGEVEQEAGTYLSYHTDPTAPSKAGDVYYVAIDVTGIGNTCAGIYADVNIGLPTGTQLAVSGANPVRCYLGFPGASHFTQDTADCPQQLGVGTTPGFYSLDPLHANPPFWPLPQGGTVEIQVPVTSSVAGAEQFEGYVQLADGEYDPTLTPGLVAVVDPATANTSGPTGNQIGIYYQTPSISGQTQPTTNGPVNVTFTGWVQNNGNDGNVVAQLAKADAAGDCSNPTQIYASNEALLQHPNTEITGNFTSLYPGGAYCWRFVATVPSGVAAGTYTGNWEYFATIGNYLTGQTGQYVPPPAKPLQVSQCTSNGSGCATSDCNSGSSCSGGGSLGGLSHSLTLSFAGNGAGSIAGPVSFACSESCSGDFAPGATVKLTATPSPGSKFIGWSGGGCSGTGACTVTMSSDQAVTATFASTAPVIVPKPSCSLSVASSKVLVHKRRGAKAPLDTLLLGAKCTQAVTGKLIGTLTEHVSKKRSKRARLSLGRVTLSAGRLETLDLKLPKAAIKALQNGVKESLTFTLSASNANGATTATASLARLRAAH